MLVEYFGPPGSGKSTLSHNLVNELSKRGLNVKELKTNQVKKRYMRVLLKSIYCIIAFAMSPIKSIKLVKKMATTGTISLKSQISNTFNFLHLYGFYLFANFQRKKSIIIYEQGFFQASSSVYIDSGKIEIGKSCFWGMEWLSNPKIVIGVHVNNAELENRLDSRSNNICIKNDYYKKQGVVFERMNSYLKNSESLFYFEVDNSNKYQLENNIEEINCYVLNLVEKYFNNGN